MTTPARATVPGMVRAAVFHYGRVVLNGTRVFDEVRTALAATPGERVLDFACGCGSFCLAVPGDYVGIDLDPHRVGFARWRWGSPRRRFECIDFEAIAEDERFDAALMVSALHHLADDVADRFLARFARMVTSRMVVVDLDPEAANAAQRFLLRRDRGRYIRPVREQRTLLERHFEIRRQARIVTTTRSTVHSLFVVSPRR